MSFLRKLDQKIRVLNHRRIEAFRSYRLSLFLMLFNQPNRSSEAVKNNSVLILRLDGKLGDTIATTGFFRELTAQGLQIDILTKKENAFVYAFVTGPVQLLELGKGFFRFFKIFLVLRKKHYGYLVCSTHILNPTSLFFSRFIKAQKKIVFLNQKIRFFDVHVSDGFYTEHVTERLNQTLLAITGKKSNQLGEYVLKIPASDEFRAREKLKKVNLSDKKIIVLNSFAGAKLRNFSFVTTKELVEKLTPHFLVISIGNTGDLDILREWKKEIQNPLWIIFDDGDFVFNAALVKLADVVVTPDTSIVHLASAFEKKLVAIYREDFAEELNAKIWAPKAKGHKVIYAPGIDINTVSTDDVVSAVFQISGKTSNSI